MAKQTPDPMVIGGKIAPGSPLSRLQAAFDDEETGVLAGDLRDVCKACDQKDDVVAKLVTSIGEKPKGERVIVSTDDVEHLTAMLVAPPAMQALEPAPAKVFQESDPAMQAAKDRMGVGDTHKGHQAKQNR